MKRLIISVFCAVAFGACGGSSDNNGDPTLIPDAAAGTDAGSTLECNPVTQAGCETGEKCAQLVESAEPFLARTTCVPGDGEVGEGNACTPGVPGAETGFDDCVAGYTCINSVCTEICDVGPPDGCRADGEAFGEGSYCTLYEGLFTDTIGVCVAGCNPVDDSVADGAISNADCTGSEGCYLNTSRGVAACAGVPADSAEVTQNEDCHGPESGGCYLNGCASGFTTALNNAAVEADGSVCARFCTPVDTYVGNVGDATGQDDKCSLANLSQAGGTNGVQEDHQCRFIQNFYGNTDSVPAGIGMCVPISSPGGGSWSDCKLYDHAGLVAAYNGAADAAAQEAAFNNFCFETTPGETEPVLTTQCAGLFRGCISLEKENDLVDVGGAIFNKEAWANRNGIDLKALNPAAAAKL
ncbi:MAG: hypothetical protein GY811_13200 [Myxococcales bacterium]|nr:hypothetical protein [Myxococcales bacterium]